MYVTPSCPLLFKAGTMHYDDIWYAPVNDSLDITRFIVNVRLNVRGKLIELFGPDMAKLR